MAVTRTFSFGLSLSIASSLFLAFVVGLVSIPEGVGHVLLNLTITLVALSPVLAISALTEVNRAVLHPDGTVELYTWLRRHRMPAREVYGLGEGLGAIVHTSQGAFLVFSFDNEEYTDFVFAMRRLRVPISLDGYDVPGVPS